MLYKPGICNIGKNEIRKRYALGASGFILTAILFYLLYVYNFSTLWFVVLVFPMYLGFEGLYQGYFHFCAGFGMSGRYDFRGTRNEQGRVKNKKQHMQDLVRSMWIHVYSVWSAVFVTIVIVFLQVIFF